MDARTTREDIWEVGGYALAVTLALFVRLVALGHAPLGDAEADLALRAWHLSRGQATALGPAPLYTLWTAAVFFLFGATDFTARLVPALLGSILVLLPFFWRRWLGREVALGLALALALDPALVAVSRTAGGAALALTLTLAAGTWLWQRRWPTAVLAAGLALLAGSETWLGALGLLAAGLAGWRLGFTAEHPVAEEAKPEWPTVGLAWLLAVTLLGTVPAGIGGLAQGLVAFVQGWRPGGEVPWWVPWAATALGAPLAWGLALLGATLARPGWKSTDWRGWATLWALAAFLLAALYPARRPFDGMWGMVPLWALALDAAARFWRGGLTIFELAHAGVTGLLSVYVWLSGGMLWQSGRPWGVGLLVLLVVALLAGASFWVMFHTSPQRSLKGLTLGFGLALALLSLRQVSQVLVTPGDTLFTSASAADPQVRLLQRTVARVARWRHGRPDTLEVKVLDLGPALRWALHDVHSVQETAALTPTDLPEAFVTPGEAQAMGLGAGYRGQDFICARDPLWVRVQGTAWVQWYFFGEAPLAGARCILWVRGDLFPGGASADNP